MAKSIGLHSSENNLPLIRKARGEQSIKFSDFVEIVKPEYVYLQLKPHSSVKNTSTDKIARAINNLYVESNALARVEEYVVKEFFGKQHLLPKLTINQQAKVSYFIDITKDDVQFYFIIPKRYESLLRDKIRNSWRNIEIKEVPAFEWFSENAVKYALDYSNKDAFSLDADKRDNELISSNLNVMEIMKEGDRVGILYNFIPTNQFTWHATYRDCMRDMKKGKSISKKSKNRKQSIINFVDMLCNGISDVLAVLSTGENSKRYIPPTPIELEYISNSTRKKSSDTVVETQICVFSDSPDKLSAKNNARAVVNSFDTISGDNSLKAVKLKGDVNPLNLKIGDRSMKSSTSEISNYIALPGDGLLKQYPSISRIENIETIIDKELTSGRMCLGSYTYRTECVNVYATVDIDYECLSHTIVAPPRSGKTEFMKNLAKDLIDAGECVIIPDFIGKGELTNDIMNSVPPEKRLIIKCNDINKLQAMMYNEVPWSDDPFQRYHTAKMQATQLKQLIDSMNNDSDSLRPRMRRYLQAASLVVFVNRGSIDDVFSVLQEPEVRHQWIEKIPPEIDVYIKTHVMSLLELDENVNGRILNRTDRISGIIDRQQSLQDNTYMELMLKAPAENNYNLLEEIDKNQIIAIQAPEDMFATLQEKDAYCTYWITKLWLALQLRYSASEDVKRMRKVNLFIDELFQTENTMLFVGQIINQMPKFRVKPIFSCHNIEDLSPIKKRLLHSNASFTLISGCIDEDLAQLGNKFDPYTPEELKALPRFSALHCMKCSKGYSVFKTQLPPELKNRRYE